MKAIILCGGFGTRLSSMFPNTPKPLVPILGRVFLRHLLELILSSKAIDTIILSCFYKTELFEKEFSEEIKLGKIVISEEKEKLGTGGAIFFNLKNLEENEAALILNGDSILKVNLENFINFSKQKNNDICLCLAKVENSSRYGKVEITQNKSVKKFVEKNINDTSAGLINAGIYVVNKNLLNHFKNQEASFSFEEVVLQSLGKRSKITNSTFLVDGVFLDIGVPEDYLKADGFVKDFCGA
jgi:D-glycero-alpha-D-manno-heptose 1-phosphate guanylyltransferase